MYKRQGETQEASYTFSVGDTGILLDIQMPGEEMENDSAKAVVTAYTCLLYTSRCV